MVMHLTLLVPSVILMAALTTGYEVCSLEINKLVVRVINC